VTGSGDEYGLETEDAPDVDDTGSDMLLYVSFICVGVPFRALTCGDDRGYSQQPSTTTNEPGRRSTRSRVQNMNNTGAGDPSVSAP
jgi:hypothetical protein